MLKPLRIGIVVGEMSGDFLGANLIYALRQFYPNITVEGIVGPQLMSAGAKAIFSMDNIAGFGIVEIIGKIPKILRVRRAIRAHFLENPPDIFIGIDAPDFNLTLEQQLRETGIPTVHYVSPTVWAWRQWRWRKIAKAVDLMLTLFPFEKSFYDKHGINSTFVGHPLADRIPIVSDQQSARHQLQLPIDKPIIALLPGSRASELNHHSQLFIETALWSLQQNPNLHFITALATPLCREIFCRHLQALAPNLPITLFDGKATEVMTAADAVLLASGTATLECALVGRPMVVAYRVSWLTSRIAYLLAKIKFASLPNLLANRELVPEFIQQYATVANIGPALLHQLHDQHNAAMLATEFSKIHHSLFSNQGKSAATAILRMLTEKGVLSGRVIAERITAEV